VISNDGLYEKLLTQAERESLRTENSGIRPVSDLEEKKSLLVAHLGGLISDQIAAAENAADLQYLESRITLAAGGAQLAYDDDSLLELRWLSQTPAIDRDRFENSRPFTPLANLALFTNAREEIRIDLELERELATADEVDILVSFIKMSGLRLVRDALLKLRDRGVRVRVITTTYMGATDKKAIDSLVNDLGAEVRIDLLPVSNRLHAKAWLFKRKSGYSTALIGSSNMSYSALTSGSEWNVRLAEAKAPSLFSKFSAAFDSYWEADEYRHYSTIEYGQALEESLARQSKEGSSSKYFLPTIEVTPRPHQIKMLDELDVARTVFGHSRNLVVAATGTGKTVLAALDYKRLIQAGRPRPTLLFVAHRQEILQQAMATFRQVLGDANFGEMLVGGSKPKDWRFVFASIQSLKPDLMRGLDPKHFKHLIVDEFHHAEAPSYQFLFTSLDPLEIVGLTATPERTDGIENIRRDVFGGRIATELRLWDALSQDLLSPFHYFGIGEELDYSQLPWVSGGYESRSLNNLITGNTVRNRNVLRELEKRLPNLASMKALLFCVSVEHANKVAQDFTEMGVVVKAVTGTTEHRSSIIQELRSGAIQGIATVDVFNEGVDIPEVDTIVLLRPTESPVVFLQQIGRGLRLTPGKESVLILDFIGAHRSEYRIDAKFSALSGAGRAEVMKNVEQGFPYLPSGSAIKLDAISRDHVLDLMKRQIKPTWNKLVLEVRNAKFESLDQYLQYSGRELFEIYSKTGRSWLGAALEAGLVHMDIDEIDESLLRRVNKLSHIDDNARLTGYAKLLSSDSRNWHALSEADRRLASMLFWNLFDDGKRPWDGEEWKSIDAAFDCLKGSKPFIWEVANLFEHLKNKLKIKAVPFVLIAGEHPFLLHATYSRSELLGGLGFARLPNSSIYEGPRRGVSAAVEGVYHIEEAQLDVFFVNLNKSESISESIRYRDYAVSPTLFHWESQGRTSDSSETGKRYIGQRASKHDVVIAVREKASGPNGTIHFRLLGPADYVNHSGSRPISILWKLREPMDPDSFQIAAAAKVS
jgi:superfamily II DNA or RNA helicase/HKD family nuclease